MNYTAKLDSGQQIYLSNHEKQTKISLSSDGNNQSSSFTTGKWTEKPQLFHVGDGFVAQLALENGPQFVSITSGGIETLDEKPNLDDAKAVELGESDDEPEAEPMKPIVPMKPMAPMKPMS